MSDAPKFSIVTPLHHAANLFIEATYASLVKQTVGEWEWIVLQNHGGQVAANSAIRTDPRVRLLDADRAAKGIGALKHIACLAASAPVLVELDADDLLAPDALAELDKAFADGADFVYSDAAHFQDGSWQSKSNLYPYRADYGWETYDVECDGHPLIAMRSPPPTAHNLRLVDFAPDHVRAWTKEAYLSVGGHDPTFEVGDDHDLCTRFYLAKKRMVHIPKCLYFYRVHEANTVAQRNAAIRDATMRVYNRYIWALAEAWADRHPLGLRKVDVCGALDRRPGYLCLDSDAPEDGQSKFELCDLDGRWPLHDRSIGVLRAHDALEHLKDPIHAMNEAARVLHPGGWLMVHVPSTNGQGAFCDPTHRSYWNRLSFRYYTEAHYARYVRAFQGAFQVSRILEWFPSEWHKTENVPYVEAHLIRLGEGYVPMGEVAWPKRTGR